jgi:hypothetical protein
VATYETGSSTQGELPVLLCGATSVLPRWSGMVEEDRAGILAPGLGQSGRTDAAYFVRHEPGEGTLDSPGEIKMDT